jgi:iron(III) transport system substrate-binding protein
MIRAFQKKYPFIKVKLNRLGSERLLTKVLAEYRAGKNFADVIQTVEFSMHTFIKRKILQRYIPTENRYFPKDFKEEGYWTTAYFNPYVTAYNTELVSKENLPKTYQDLLKPSWKGKMMLEGTKVDWFAGMLHIMGREKGLEYMRALAKQNLTLQRGHTLIAQLIAAGEALIDVNIPASSVTRMSKRGAPLDWTALGTVPGIMVGTGLAAGARHPNAAKLYINFLLSLESQKTLYGFGRMVGRKEVAEEQSQRMRGIKIYPVDPGLADDINEYAKLLHGIFGKTGSSQ